MNLVIDHPLVSGMVARPVIAVLSHNLPISSAAFYVVHFLNQLNTELQLVVRGESLVFSVASIVQGRRYKLIAYGISNGVIDGVWWVDAYVYAPDQAQIQFTARTDVAAGEPGAFSGTVQINGQGVARQVIGVALDADPPYLLAQTQSAANGSYTLQWQGYSGQLLVTALDDYGQPFTPGMTLGAGDRVHPAAPNGFVYQAAGLGIAGDEPEWPIVEGDSITTGEVQLVAVPFWRPKSAGPFSV